MEQNFPGGEAALLVKDTINHIKAYLTAKDFCCQEGLVETLYLSLKSKPFVILTGPSGVGKSRLPALFARAVGATRENGRYYMLPVGPDWSTPSDLFGRLDENGRRSPGPLLDFVQRAAEDGERPYFLCLDDMNLARTEYYLSSILSVMETRAFDGGAIVTAPLLPAADLGSDMPLGWPDNLYLFGTVTMDETTFSLSRRVLDRAHVISLASGSLIPDFDVLNQEPPPALSLGNSFLKSEVLCLSQCAADSEAVVAFCQRLQEVERALHEMKLSMGYRVRDEIVFYLLGNQRDALLPELMAMDFALLQRVLPLVQGSGTEVKTALCALFRFCAGEYGAYHTASGRVSDQMREALRDAMQPVKYRRSAEKLEWMTRRWEEDGFTSYWL